MASQRRHIPAPDQPLSYCSQHRPKQERSANKSRREACVYATQRRECPSCPSAKPDAIVAPSATEISKLAIAPTDASDPPSSPIVRVAFLVVHVLFSLVLVSSRRFLNTCSPTKERLAIPAHRQDLAHPLGRLLPRRSLGSVRAPCPDTSNANWSASEKRHSSAMAAT